VVLPDDGRHVWDKEDASGLVLTNKKRGCHGIVFIFFTLVAQLVGHDSPMRVANMANFPKFRLPSAEGGLYRAGVVW
jgi:hypothetical protein